MNKIRERIKNSTLFLLTISFVSLLLADCSRETFNEFRITMGASQNKVFGSLTTLYNPILNPLLKEYQLTEKWDKIDTYINCGLRKYENFVVLLKYSLPFEPIYKTFDGARERLKEFTLERVRKKKNLKILLNPLYQDKEDVYKVLNGALLALDKNTPSKKIDPQSLFPGYKEFYTSLVKYAAKNSSKPLDTLVRERVLTFLMGYKDTDGKAVLYPSIVTDIDLEKNFSCSPQTAQRAKNFVVKLHDVLYALKTDTSFEIPIFGTKRAVQIGVLQKVIKILQEGCGFNLGETIPTPLLKKLFLTKDEQSFLVIAEAIGLYNALKEVIDYIEKNKK